MLTLTVHPSGMLSAAYELAQMHYPFADLHDLGMPRIPALLAVISSLR